MNPTNGFIQDKSKFWSLQDIDPSQLAKCQASTSLSQKECRNYILPWMTKSIKLNKSSRILGISEADSAKSGKAGRKIQRSSWGLLLKPSSWAKRRRKITRCSKRKSSTDAIPRWNITVRNDGWKFVEMLVFARLLLNWTN